LSVSFVIFFPRDINVEKLILSLQNLPTSKEAAANQENIQLHIQNSQKLDSGKINRNLNSGSLEILP